MARPRVGPLLLAAGVIGAAEISQIVAAMRGPTHSLSVHEDNLYATVIDTIYGRQTARVFLQQHTESGSEYLADPTIRAALSALLGQGVATETIAAFQARNARPTGLSMGVQTEPGYVVVDSA